ncbi:DNA damage-regulated autophagy modulator protein 2-like [Oppia nitens]|uniref:DNA damage-regulated autophagy modulator protein 2-like n=1 Tax=Oppia nitens TaxID=1686743 RepID=UPI0023DB68FC|nr:DNA damage-regulated autophagy modulator protein 2-like [Oppia nitens]
MIKLHYLLYFMSASALVFPFIIWILAVCQSKVVPIFPYISDVGTVPPGASLFSLMMNVIGFMLLMLAKIRYDIIKLSIAHKDIIDGDNLVAIKRWSRWSLISGCITSGSAVMIGNFRSAEMFLVQSVHCMVAATLFMGSIIDMAMQSKVAYLMSDKRTGRYRFILTIVNLFVNSVSGLTGLISLIQYYPEILENANRMAWDSSKPGYIPHVISALFEWFIAFIWCPYVLTYARDFKQYSLSKTLIVYKDVNQNETTVAYNSKNDI